MLRQAKLTLSAVANVGLVVFLVLVIIFGVRCGERRTESLLDCKRLLEESVNRRTLLLAVVLVPGSAVVVGLLSLLRRVVRTTPSHFGCVLGSTSVADTRSTGNSQTCVTIESSAKNGEAMNTENKG